MFINKKHLVFLLFSMLVTGLISIYLGQDSNWDLNNYHYYNGYAFLNLSLDHDFFTAGIQSYFNPLMDTVHYLVIKYLPPKLTGFVLGAMQGVNFYLLAVMANMLIKSSISITNRFLIIAGITLLGFLSANVLGEIGTTFADLTVSNWVLLSILIMGIAFKQVLTNKKLTLIGLSGVCVGVAVGLKLTMLIFLMGALMAIFFSEEKSARYKCFALLLLCSILGFLLVNGYWMILLWKYFKNPIFPLYNKFFKSPYFNFGNPVDPRFFPRDMLQTLFYPFYFSWKKLTSEVIFRDFRLAVVYLLLIIYIARIVFKKKIYSQDYSLSQNQFSRYLIIFFVTSYVIWQFQFSIQRYAMPLDILAPLLIYILITKIFKNIYPILILTFAFLILTLKPMNWGRSQWTQSFFDVKIPQNIISHKQAVVLIFQPPIAFLRPFFPADWHFISGDVDPSPYYYQLANKWLQGGDHSFFILYREMPYQELMSKIKPYGFNFLGPCGKINTKGGGYFICSIFL